MVVEDMPMGPTGAADSSLIARVRRHASAQPDALGLVFVRRAALAVEFTWARLCVEIETSAARLVRAGVAPGDVFFVLSAAPHEQALMFLGAMAAGALPTILSFPSIKQSEERFHETLRPIALSTGARWIASAPEFAPAVERAGVPAQLLLIGPNDSAPSSDAALPVSSGDFLQFSSGTTGLRKCVRITFEMLTSQAEAYGRALGLTAADRIASWLPLYHDMGLVACLLVPLYHGNLSVHLSPFEWLNEPELLFSSIARYRASLVWLPNFAYKLCADQRTGERLDLGSLRAVINCSEPVRPGAHEHFLRCFGAAGVRAEHLLACYAMAEATFAVTQTKPGAPASVDRVQARPFSSEHRAEPAPPDAAPAEVLAFVSSGHPIDGIEVRIDGAEGEERRVGEILVRGASVIPGYGVDGASALDAFPGEGWYRTGDLGYLAGGELFVTGRAKDLIIHRGSNIYPADIEEVLAEIEGIKPGRAVVFGIYDDAEGTEGVVVALEPDGRVEPADLPRRVREEVWLRLHVAVADVDIGEPGSLLKSTSGKLSRSANRAAYLERRKARAGEADRRPRPTLPVTYVAPRDLWERQLACIWEEALDIHPVGVHDKLFLDLGADSVATMRAAAEIQRLLGRVIQPAALLGADTIEDQARLLRALQGGATAGPLVTLQRRGPQRPLFLVHAAGGWAFPYVALARALGSERPVHAFQTRALEDGTGSSLTVEGMARDYIAAMRQVQPTGPYIIGGWSLGGLVAFEMAVMLEREGERVARLVMFDTTPPRRRLERARGWLRGQGIRALFERGLRAPWLFRLSIFRPFNELTPVWRFFVACILTGAERDIAPLVAFAFGDRCDRRRLSGLGPDAAWDYVVDLARAHAAPADQLLLVPGLDGAGARRALRVSRRLEQLNAQYEPGRRYGGSLDIVGVEGNEKLARWQRYIEGEVRLHFFPVKKHLVNAHFDMMEPANVALFASALGRLLSEEPE